MGWCGPGRPWTPAYGAAKNAAHWIKGYSEPYYRSNSWRIEPKAFGQVLQRLAFGPDDAVKQLRAFAKA